MRMLALRGRFEVQGTPMVDVELSPGLTLKIADTTFTVLSVILPSTTLALELPGLGRVALGSVTSLRPTPQGVELHAGFLAESDAVLWDDGETFHLRRPAMEDTSLHGGERFLVGSHEVRVVVVSTADTEPTDRDPTRSPLRLVLRHDTVHIHHEGRALSLDGVPARIVSELGLMGQPVEWRVVARELWRDEPEDQALRRRWDRGLARLRATLRELGLREDLVRLTGAGRVELYLLPQDTLRDQM